MTRILVIQTAFIGDVILATALLEQIRQQRPEAQIDMLLRKGNESLLANHPFLHSVLIWDKKGGKYKNLWNLLGQIRQNEYDVVINLQRFGATGLLTALSGARQTIGYDKNPFSRFFKYRIEHRIEPGIHEVDRNAALLGPMGIGTFVAPRPRLYPSPADRQAVAPYQEKPYLCIAPTSVWFTKQYPAEKWVEFIRQNPADTTIYLLGAPTDIDACAYIRQQVLATHPHVQNLAGKLSFLQSAALMQGAIMNYVNDSAPMHLCSAVNAPTTAVFCSTIPAFGFGPLADDARIVQTPEPLDCRPCGLHGYRACPLGHFRCATTIEIASNR
ncbi:glycosyltransferase family 9 protein [Rudanella lutea]|uniref:glycosyltransferase family 9 protein n=1 Tax=Rudanella lutea TaxID=451374 RepID=UPI00035F3EA2|nr:glycosyltransferase family 9 protein [Rudanella lutea]